jgi:hypothetical protein
MKSKYFKSKTIEDVFKFDDGIDSYFLQLSDGGFVILEKEVDIPLIEISEEEFKVALINTGLIPIISNLIK